MDYTVFSLGDQAMKITESIPVWLIYYRSDYGTQLENIFTDKDIAEKALKEYKETEKNPSRWTMMQRYTSTE